VTIPNLVPRSDAPPWYETCPDGEHETSELIQIRRIGWLAERAYDLGLVQLTNVVKNVDAISPHML